VRNEIEEGQSSQRGLRGAYASRAAPQGRDLVWNELADCQSGLRSTNGNRGVPILAELRRKGGMKWPTNV